MANEVNGRYSDFRLEDQVDYCAGSENYGPSIEVYSRHQKRNGSRYREESVYLLKMIFMGSKIRWEKFQEMNVLYRYVVFKIGKEISIARSCLTFRSEQCPKKNFNKKMRLVNLPRKYQLQKN